MPSGSSYKLSELPDNLYLSPHFLFDWWDGVVAHNGPEAIFYDKSLDFKKARELWVAAIFAVCMRIKSGNEHWVKAVKENAPDAIAAYFEEHKLGMAELKYPVEVTTYGKHSDSLEEVLKSKLDMSYDPETRIVCYITDRGNPEDLDIKKLSNFVAKNNRSGYTVWLLGEIEAPSFPTGFCLSLLCLTNSERYDIDYSKEKLVKNMSEAFRIGQGKSTNKAVTFVGQLHLQFPSK